MRSGFLLVFAAAGLALAQSANAGTWKVGHDPTDCPGGCDFSDFSTGGEIGGGIERAMVSPSVFPGDTILVYPRPGVPPEELCFDGTESGVINAFTIRFNIKSGVILAAALGPGTVCIRGGAGGEAGINFVNTSEATIVDGMRITWDATPSGLGGGITCYVASGVVKNCIFENCLAGTGSGVYQFLSDVRIENNLFNENDCVAGGGVVALSSSPATIINNTFRRSEAPFGFQGAAFYASDSGHRFDKNIISESIGASAFFCAGSNPATVTCNLFWDNPVGVGGGSCADQTGTNGNQNGNPGFCDPDNGDFNVCANSPALIGPCGQVGYVPPTGGTCADCPGTSSVEALSWGSIKALYR
jgi:hypothetical protein